MNKPVDINASGAMLSINLLMMAVDGCGTRGIKSDDIVFLVGRAQRLSLIFVLLYIRYDKEPERDAIVQAIESGEVLRDLKILGVLCTLHDSVPPDELWIVDKNERIGQIRALAIPSGYATGEVVENVA